MTNNYVNTDVDWYVCWMIQLHVGQCKGPTFWYSGVGGSAELWAWINLKGKISYNCNYFNNLFLGDIKFSLLSPHRIPNGRFLTMVILAMLVLLWKQGTYMSSGCTMFSIRHSNVWYLKIKRSTSQRITGLHYLLNLTPLGE